MAVIFKKQGKGTPFSIRLSPKTKFGLELLSRVTRRTNSAVIEVALEKEIKAELNLDVNGRKQNLADVVWDPDLICRFVKMAQFAPDILSIEEEMWWKIICDDEKYFEMEEPNCEMIRKDWAIITKKADDRL